MSLVLRWSAVESATIYGVRVQHVSSGGPELVLETYLKNPRLTVSASRPGSGHKAGDADVELADITKDEDIRALAGAVTSRFGKVDVLVHAAGVIALDPVEQAPVEDLDRQYRTNLRAPYLLTQALIGAYGQHEGRSSSSIRPPVEPRNPVQATMRRRSTGSRRCQWWRGWRPGWGSWRQSIASARSVRWPITRMVRWCWPAGAQRPQAGANDRPSSTYRAVGERGRRSPLDRGERRGNREDSTSVEPALVRLDALRAALPQDRPPLVVGDSKLLSTSNVGAFERRQLRFLCPHRKDAPMKRRLAALDEAALAPLVYRAERHKQSAEPRYLACEGELTVAGVALRALYVLSLDDQDAARAQRERQLARAAEEIASLNRGAPTFRRTAGEIERRARAILERRRVDALTRLWVVEEGGYPQARVERDPEAIAAAERLDGRYAWSATTTPSPPTSSSPPTSASTSSKAASPTSKARSPSAPSSSTPTAASPPSSA